MDREQLLKILRDHKKALEKFGVKKIGIFGSFRSNKGSLLSDVDLVVEFENGWGTFKNFGGLVEYLENLLGRTVDILTPVGIESIRIEEIRENIKRELIYV